MQNRLLVLTAVALLATPAAAAWGLRGDHEPNTGRDVTDGYMFLSPPQSAADAGKVYFNGWMTNGFSTNPTIGPNEGRLGTGIMPNALKAFAVLGVWRDCNKDGFIGSGDPGLIEYPAAYPGVDTTLCPATTPPDPIPAYGWRPVHNDGTWIHEYLPLGWEEWRTMWNDTDPLASKTTIKEEDDNPWDLNDTDARVWVDVHLPEARLGGSNCYINPQPRGTLQSTGGVIESADCFTGFRVTDGLTTAGNAGADGTAAGQLSFKDKPRDQSNSSSRLNRANPWGQPGDSEYVSHWDCTQPQVQNIVVRHPVTGNTVFFTNVSAPKVPSGVNAGGSPAGQVNSTQGGFDQCHRSPTGDNDADIYDIVEGDVVNSARKVKPSDVLFYNEGARRHFVHFLPTDTKVQRPVPGQPTDGGARVGEIGVVVASSSLSTEGLWQGLTTMLVAPVSTTSFAPNPIRHVTFYASVGAAATSRWGLSFPGSPGSYGSENCALPLADRLFECNPALWWPGNTEPRSTNLGAESEDSYTRCNFTGTTDTSGCRTWGARVGKTYQLRDIDCYDYSAKGVREEGVHWGALTNTQCV